MLTFSLALSQLCYKTAGKSMLATLSLSPSLVCVPIDTHTLCVLSGTQRRKNARGSVENSRTHSVENAFYNARRVARTEIELCRLPVLVLVCVCVCVCVGVCVFLVFVLCVCVC